MGREALSRGAERAFCVENDRRALTALLANFHDCGWEVRCTVYPRDDTVQPAARATPATLVFLAPPYHEHLPGTALAALKARGWIAPNAIAVIETGRDEPLPFANDTEDAPACPHELLAERQHGAARLSIWRLA